MLEILKYIFSNFWIWLGTVILISVAVSPFGTLTKVIIKKIKEG